MRKEPNIFMTSNNFSKVLMLNGKSLAEGAYVDNIDLSDEISSLDCTLFHTKYKPVEKLHELCMETFIVFNADKEGEAPLIKFDETYESMYLYFIDDSEGSSKVYVYKLKYLTYEINSFGDLKIKLWFNTSPETSYKIHRLNPISLFKNYMKLTPLEYNNIIKNNYNDCIIITKPNISGFVAYSDTIDDVIFFFRGGIAQLTHTSDKDQWLCENMRFLLSDGWISPFISKNDGEYELNNDSLEEIVKLKLDIPNIELTTLDTLVLSRMIINTAYAIEDKINLTINFNKYKINIARYIKLLKEIARNNTIITVSCKYDKFKLRIISISEDKCELLKSKGDD